MPYTITNSCGQVHNLSERNEHSRSGATLKGNCEMRKNMFLKCSRVGLSMLILAAAILIVDANNCRAQSQNVPNLGGTWELIEYDGVTKDRLGSKFPKLTLAISQTASEVKISQKGFRGGVEEVREFTYYTDVGVRRILGASNSGPVTCRNLSPSLTGKRTD